MSTAELVESSVTVQFYGEESQIQYTLCEGVTPKDGHSVFCIGVVVMDKLLDRWATMACNVQNVSGGQSGSHGQDKCRGSASVEVIEQFGVAVAQTPSCCAKGSASVKVIRTVWCCCCTDS